MDDQQDNQGIPADAGAASAQATAADDGARRLAMRTQRLRLEIEEWLKWRWSCP